MSDIEIATLEARVEFLEKENNKLENKYKEFKKDIRKYFFENIIEKLDYDGIESREGIINMIDIVLYEWEEYYDEFVDSFDSVHQEQKKVQDSSNAIDKKYHRWKTDFMVWNETQPEIQILMNLTFKERVSEFLSYKIYVSKEYPVIEEKRKRIEACQNLFNYILGTSPWRVCVQPPRVGGETTL